MRKFINFTNRTMFDRVWCNCDTNKLSQKRPKLLCTISGGQDSIVNFFIIFSFLYFQQQKMLTQKSFVKKQTDNIKILYCQHFWQIKNFFLTFLIFRVSFFFRIPFVLVLAENSFLNENRSRGWRKKNFYRVCRLEKIITLITGHTQTDTVEKNCNNLFRGTSGKGLTQLKYLSQKKNQNMFFSNLILEWSFSEKDRFSDQQFNLFFYYKTNTKCSRITNFLTNPNNFYYFQRKKNNLKQFCSDSPSFGYTNNRLRNKNYQFKGYLQSISFCFYSKTINQKLNFDKPLQTIRRSTISELITFFKLPLLLDLTNYSSNFSRNKIRHEIFPFIKSRYHKKVENLLGNFFQTIGLELQEIDKQTIEIFFLYKILPLNYFQSLESSRKTYVPLTFERSFLQKIIVDYKNIELLFSQLSGIQAEIF